MNRGPMTYERVSLKAVWGGNVAKLAGPLALLALTMFSASCGDLTREGTASSYLVISALEAASGAQPQLFGATLDSDVITVVDGSPTVFSDLGRVKLVLAMKDAGSVDTPTTPTVNNFITITRYRVRYTRADGRNTPGVDVPYGFDGAFTGTVGAGEFTAGFELVRHIAKEESPLQALGRNRAVIISTITEITFYGHDQTGRDVSVTGQLLVSFGDFGDPS
jgi:hypothetical protein